MADKSKKNVYRKTMGFNHNRVKTTVEMVTNATKGLIADVKHSVQQYGSNNSVIGSKEPHKKISNANMGTFKRPPYKKNKFKGAKDGYEKNSLGSYGNRKDNPEIFTMIGKARRKLVKRYIMPNTAKTDIEVAQRAMVLVGMEPLSSFTEATDEALVMNTTYEDMVEDCLAQNNWNFATGQIVLSRLADVPVDRWESAYAMPTEPSVIQVQTITIGGVVQTYDIYEKYIYINASETDVVVLNYIYRVDTQYWTPAFTLWVVYRLASVLALSVTRKADIAKSYREMADLQFRRAKARDAQQVTTQQVSLSRYHQIRNGSGLFVKIDGSES